MVADSGGQLASTVNNVLTNGGFLDSLEAKRKSCGAKDLNQRRV